MKQSEGDIQDWDRLGLGRLGSSAQSREQTYRAAGRERWTADKDSNRACVACKRGKVLEARKICISRGYGVVCTQALVLLFDCTVNEQALHVSVSLIKRYRVFMILCLVLGKLLQN